MNKYGSIIFLALGGSKDVQPPPTCLKESKLKKDALPKQGQFESNPKSSTQVPPPDRTTRSAWEYTFLTLLRKPIRKSRDTVRRVPQAV